VANGIKLQNVYMTFGGTSWGWLPASVVYTSYDYGAAISEPRQLTAKIPAMKELGYFLQAVPDINKVDTASPVSASNSLVKTYHLANPDTGTNFFFVRNDHTPDLTFTVPVSTPDGSYTVPQNGTLQLNGKDMKVIVAGYQLDSAHLVYSTSHLMTHAPIGDQDVAVLASRPGDDGETVLRYPAAASGPAVRVLAGTGVTSSWTPAPATCCSTTRTRMSPGSKSPRPAVPGHCSCWPWTTPRPARSGGWTPGLARCWSAGRRWSAPRPCAGWCWSSPGTPRRPHRSRCERPARSAPCGGTAGRSR
jgi:Beta-galactosidase, domain 2/Glycosyl hydrolases family 35